MRRHGYDLGRPERAYLSKCADLPSQMRGFFKTLVQNKEEALLLIRERLYASPGLMDGFVNDYFCDVRPYFVFASKYRRAVFTEYDCLVLDTLTSTNSFSEEVDRQMPNAPTLAAAVVRTFVEMVFIKDREMGKSPIVWFVRSFIRWRIDKDIQSLSEIELVLRHVANVKAWGDEPKETCPMKGHEDVFGPLFLSFMKERCLTSVDREIVLSLEKSLFNPSDDDVVRVMDRIKKYKEAGIWTINDLKERFDFVRRRLVAYFVVISRPIPHAEDLNFLPVDPLLTPFVDLTNLSSLGEAKLLSETDSSHLCPVVFSTKEQEDALDDVQFYYEQLGVKTEMGQDDNGLCLKINMSLIDGEHSASPVTWIYPTGSFHDTKWEVFGNYKEAL